MKRYVVGFAFDPEGNVALMRKSHPEWQRGKLNGVGGKINPEDATPLDAMVREWGEETGVMLLKKDWSHVCTIEGESETTSDTGSRLYRKEQFRLYVFATFGVNVGLVAEGLRKCSPEEPGYVVWGRDIEDENVIPNLNYLIPMALNSNRADWPLLIIENGGDV